MIRTNRFLSQITKGYLSESFEELLESVRGCVERQVADEDVVVLDAIDLIRKELLNKTYPTQKFAS